MILGRVMGFIPLTMVLGFFVTLIYFAIAFTLVTDYNLVSEITEIQTNFAEIFEILGDALS